MLRKAILVDREDTCWVEREVVRFVERDTLRCTIDIHTLHRTVTLHNAFTSSIVSVTTRFAIVREYHQTVVFIPVHLSSSFRRVIRYQRWITVSIVCVMVMADLCRGRRMVAVLVLISEVIRLSSCR